MTLSHNKYEPRYKRALRIIGRYLNQRKARLVTLADIDGGYMTHFASEGDLSHFEGFAIHEDDLHDLEQIFRTRRGQPGRTGVFAGMQSFFGFHRDEGLHFQRSHPVCPQGYEEVLRSLGSRLDAQGAQDLLFTEMPTHIVLEYALPAFTYRRPSDNDPTTLSRRHETYTRAALEELVASERQRAERALVGTAERLLLAPGDHRLYMEAGRMFHDEGNFAEAADLYRMVISLLPNNMEAYHRLAELSLERRQHADAIDALRHGLQIDPTNARTYGLLAMAYMRAGQSRPAMEALEQACRLDPTNRTYRARLAQLVAPPSAEPPMPPTSAEPTQPVPRERKSSELAADDGSPKRPITAEPSSAQGPDGVPAALQSTDTSDSLAAMDDVDPFDRSHPDADIPLSWADPTLPPLVATSRSGAETMKPAGTPPRVNEIGDGAGAVSNLTGLTASAVPEESLEPAIDQLRAEIAAHPDQLELHRKLGFLLARQGRTAEAAAEFRVARGESEPL